MTWGGGAEIARSKHEDICLFLLVSVFAGAVFFK